MSKQTTETFSFSDLGALRDWLNQFKTTDLDAVAFDGVDWLHIDWVEETLSDGSTVNSARVTLQPK